MLTYLLVAGPGLPAVGRGELDRRVREAAPSVLTQVGEAVLWTRASGNCLVWTWDSTSKTDTGSQRVVSDETGLFAIAGSAWSRSGWETAETVASRPEWRKRPDLLRDSLTGNFSALSIRNDGDSYVTTDSTGTGHVYLARGTDLWAASNRAPLASIGLKGDWSPDVGSQAWLAMLGMFAGSSTSVQGVEVLPAASSIVLDARDAVTVSHGITPWAAGASRPAQVEEALDDAAEALIARAAVIASNEVAEPIINLSGGKDSRLVLATFAAAGLARDVSFSTSGMPGASDREVAVMLGERLQLKLAVHTPGRDAGPDLDELDRRVRRHAFQTAGMFGALDLQGSYGDGAHINLTGLYGELMRSTYRPEEIPRSSQEVRQYLTDRMGVDRKRLLRPHVREDLEEQLRTWVDSRVEDGWAPHDLLDLFYAEVRVARWLGAAEETNAMNPTANLLQLRECILAGFAASPETRRRDELHYRLIQRLQPDLLEVPLANHHWHPELSEPGSVTNPDPVMASASAAEGWQSLGWTSHRRLIAAELLARDNVIHEIVDPKRVAVVTSRPQSPRRAAQLWAVWSASIWSSRGYEIFPWNGPSTPAVVPPSRVISALTLPPPRKPRPTPKPSSRPPGPPLSATGVYGRWRAAVARRLRLTFRSNSGH